MSNQLTRDLDSLNTDILALSSLVEEMIRKAFHALIDRDETLGQEVQDTDPKVDQMEVDIEERCIRILTLRQPVASDLRLIACIMKINNDLERIADLAVNVSKRARDLMPYPAFNIPHKLETMAFATIEMVQHSLDSFVRQDVEIARRVPVSDNQVDDLYRDILDDLRDQMKQSADLVDPATQCFTACKAFERIADLATNIAEDVIFLVEGEIARHKENAPTE